MQLSMFSANMLHVIGGVFDTDGCTTARCTWVGPAGHKVGYLVTAGLPSDIQCDTGNKLSINRFDDTRTCALLDC